MSVIKNVNGLPTEVAAYDESIYYATGLSAASTITLPNSGSFNSAAAKDIIVILNDRALEVTRDFTVVGVGPTYTQISNVYAFTNDSVIRFKQNI